MLEPSVRIFNTMVKIMIPYRLLVASDVRQIRHCFFCADIGQKDYEEALSSLATFQSVLLIVVSHI